MFCCFVVLQIDSLLKEANIVPAGEEPGPVTELEYWRKQMARINSLTEQLKRRECKLVLGVCSVAHSPVSAVTCWNSSSWCSSMCQVATLLQHTAMLAQLAFCNPAATLW
jgi:hypothetical protein